MDRSTGETWSMRLLPAKIRLMFCFLVPVAGCILVQAEDGTSYGPFLAIVLAIGLFVYHYLQWALYETHREDLRVDFPWVWQLIGVATVGFLVRGDWKDWIIEQTFLEAVSFSAAIAALSLAKATKEQIRGLKPPWFLIVCIFVSPAVALFVAILPSWVARHPDAPLWEWALVGFGFAVSAWSGYQTMKPFVAGNGAMAEPLDRPWKIVFIVVWLIFLLGVLIGFSNRG